MSAFVSAVFILHLIETISITQAVTSAPQVPSDNSFETNMRSIASGHEKCQPLECDFRTALPKHLEQAKPFVAKGWVVDVGTVPGTSGSNYHIFKLTAVGAARLSHN